MAKQIITIIRCLLAGMALSLVCTATHASTVILDGTKATGITRLDLGGTLYNVVFDRVTGTVTDPITVSPCDDPSGNGIECDLFVPFASPSSGDQTGAEAAAAAINAALNAAFAQTVGPAGGVSRTSYVVPFETCTVPEDAICGNRGVLAFGSWNNTVGDVAEIFADSGDVVFARFTASPVPLPPAVVLFGSGLALLVRVKRGRNRI